MASAVVIVNHSWVWDPLGIILTRFWGKKKKKKRFYILWVILFVSQWGVLEQMAVIYVISVIGVISEICYFRALSSLYPSPESSLFPSAVSEL